MTTTEFNEADLPELPNNAGYPFPRWVNIALRDYGRHCVAAYRKKLMEQPAVAYRSSEQYSPDVGLWFEYYDEYREINDTSGLTPLYAAPMPQANESEAVRALRRVVSNYEMNCSVRDAWSWHEDSYNAARAVLAGEPGAKGEQSTGKKDLQVQQPEQTQVMDERELFHAWFDTYADPHSGRVERNIKRKAAWDAWQARAALAQAQASEKAEKYCDDHCTWRDHDPECVIGGKAAPSIDRNAIIEECAHALEKFSLGKNSYEQGINEGFRLAAEKLRGMIKNC